MTRAEFVKLNIRRGELIDKLIAGTITEDEALELGSLNAEAEAYIHEHAPRPMDSLERLEEKLKSEGDA